MKKFWCFLPALLLFTAICSAQPFIEEIRQFRSEDSLNFPPKKANLFIGSSSLRMWKNIRSDFPEYKIINRGFGGSTLPDVIRYVNDIVYPYHPKQVLVYCGENDLASSDTVSAATVLSRFQELFGLIRAKYKKVPIVFISIKPSPSREHLIPKMVEANRLIKAFLETKKKTKYVDVFSRMLNADGKPNRDLFLDDMLHMKPAGYAIWIEAIRPVLKK
jgi:lysophospholipase L1-like esterase